MQSTRANRGIERQSFWIGLAAFLDLVYTMTVRDLRTENANASLGILLSIAIPVSSGIVFYFAMGLLRESPAPIRGDDLTFIVIGFALFFTHVRTATAVGGALRREMMNHQKATPFLLVWVKAAGSLFKNALALIVILVGNWLIRGVYEMQDLGRFIIIFLLCWVYGVAIGMVLMAMMRYLTWGNLVQTGYARLMFFTSGKFFVASHMPGAALAMLDWNPLFHLIDQGRGAVFVNYQSRVTDLPFVLYVILVLLALGFLFEHYVRTNYSASHHPGG